MTECTRCLVLWGVIPTEKAELASYQLRDVSQIRYTRWKNNRPEGPIGWEEFKEAFLGNYFPQEMREVKANEFINLKQGNISVEEYSLKFSRKDPFSCV